MATITTIGLKDAVEEYLEERLATARAEWSESSDRVRVKIFDNGREAAYDFSPRFFMDHGEEGGGGLLLHAMESLLVAIIRQPMKQGLLGNLYRRAESAEADRAKAQRELQIAEDKERLLRRLADEAYDAL